MGIEVCNKASPTSAQDVQHYFFATKNDLTPRPTPLRTRQPIVSSSGLANSVSIYKQVINK